MNADLYCRILDVHLVPFIRTMYLRSHRFMQDNDPSTHPVEQQHFLLNVVLNGGC